MPGGMKVEPERVHLHQRREVAGVAEIVGVAPSRQGRAGGRLDGDDAHLACGRAFSPKKGKAMPAKLLAAAGAADDDVGIVAGIAKLLHRLLADHGLVQQHVVEHRAERVFGVVALGGHLDRLGDGDAERAGRVGIARPEWRGRSRSYWLGLAMQRRAIGLHQRPAIGLLLVADLDHVDLDLEAEQLAGEGQRRAPLAGAGLGGQALDACLLVVEGLGHRRVGLVAAGRADALVLEENLGRGVRAPSPGAGRGSAASAATGDRCRAPARGSRCTLGETSCMMMAMGNRGARSPGPTGWPVPGCSAGGGGFGRSATRLYQAFGIRSSGSRYLVNSVMISPRSFIEFVPYICKPTLGGGQNDPPDLPIGPCFIVRIFPRAMFSKCFT